MSEQARATQQQHQLNFTTTLPHYHIAKQILNANWKYLQ